MINADKAKEQTLRFISNTDKIKALLERIDNVSQEGKGSLQVALTAEEILFLESKGFTISDKFYQESNEFIGCKLSWI